MAEGAPAFTCCLPLSLARAQGTGGMCAFKGSTFVMISVHDENIVSGACSATTGKLADYLIEQGM